MTTKSQELLARISLNRGVHYNIDNIDNKDNKDNILLTNNGFDSSSLGIEANASLVIEQVVAVEALSLREGQEISDSKSQGTLEPTPLQYTDLNSLIVQLFDNGEVAQKYKLKVRLNLVDDSNPEFVASLTKDLRNFKKYIPQECRNEIITLVQEERRRIKDLTGTYPYIGKFHLNQGRTTRSHKTQVEPWTLAVVWYNPEERDWTCIFRIQDVVLELPLATEYISDRQRKSNVKAQAVWQHPRLARQGRPKTWAEQRKERL